MNVSGRQLDHDGLIEDVRCALEHSGLDPKALTLEITETSLMRDAESTARRLRELKQLGVRIAIDDFGTGYSSLAYLRQFPVDTLKIDHSFIGAIGVSKEYRTTRRGAALKARIAPLLPRADAVSARDLGCGSYRRDR